MGLTYSFDPEKWYLGTLCKRGHRWPGTDLSIRRNYKRANRCAGCSSGNGSQSWLQKFIDHEASGVPDGFCLGAICQHGHSWNDTPYGLRRQSNGACIGCEKIRPRNPEYHKAASRRHYEANRERLLEDARARRLADPDEYRAKQAAYIASRRALHGRESRSKHGLPHRFLEDNGFHNSNANAVAELLANGATVQQIQETLPLDRWLRNATRPLSVAKLVYIEQRRYWKENPDAEIAYKRYRSAETWRWRYMCDPEFKYHARQRNHEAKIKYRQNHNVRLPREAVLNQFAAFDGNCCYCGSADRIVIDHFIPRSKGGPHVLTNLVPACHRCNTSKRDHDPATWYKSQSFYSVKRWRLILKVLGRKDATLNQLTLL
jgi:5-methylcytosine-specific restriction endonuclease McrA